MKKYYPLLTTLSVILLFVGVLILIGVKSITTNASICDCYGLKSPCINVIPSLLFFGYIISVILLRKFNLKLYKINPDIYHKKVWIWFIPIINTISIPFILWDLFMESSWGKWLKTTDFYKDLIDEE